MVILVTQSLIFFGLGLCLDKKVLFTSLLLILNTAPDDTLEINGEIALDTKKERTKEISK